MSMAGGESVHSPGATPSPEPYNHAAALRAHFSLEPEVIAEQRARLWQTAERMAALVINPSQRNAIRLYAGISEWQLLGKPGDPLPEGLLHDSPPTPRLFADGTIPYFSHASYGGIGSLDYPFRLAGGGQVFDALKQIYNTRSEAIRHTITDYITQTAAYGLLRSFDVQERKPQEQPLNDYWRQIRERQITDAVLTKHAHTQATLPPWSAGDQELRRRRQLLNEETMPTATEQPNAANALARARAYFTPFVARAFESGPDHYKDEQFGEVCYTEDMGLFIRPKGEEIGPDFEDFADKAGWLISQELHVGSRELQFVAAAFLGQAIYRIMDPRTTAPLHTIIEQAVREATDIAYEDLAYAAALGEVGYIYSSTYIERHDTTLFLRQPHATHYTPRQDTPKNPYTWEGVFHSYSKFSTAGEILRDMHREIGYVHTYQPPHFRAESRIMQPQARTQELPDRAPHEDLALTLYKGYGEGAVPFLPGYLLVSESAAEGRYGFVVDPNGDPYAPCDIPIEQHARLALANHYRALGLESLADEVATHRGMTVRQLVTHIRQASTYWAPDYLPSYPTDSNVLTRRQTNVENLAAFAPYIQDGTLLTQCTGSAQFLKYSLEALFGVGCAGIVNGHTISGSTQSISATRHAQLLFTHGDKQYILDATPTWDRAGTADRFPADATPKPGHVAPQAPHFERASHLPLTDIPATLQTEKTLDQQAGELLQSLTERLRAAFAMPDRQSLYDYVVGLPEHNPARRALETAYRFAHGIASIEEIQALDDYTATCLRADAEARYKLGFGHYTVDFLEQLQNVATSAQRIHDRTPSPDEV